jgi:hypothetical protein
MSSKPKKRDIIKFVSARHKHKGSYILNQVDQPSGETPCRLNVDVFDSPYLSDFDALEYQEERPDMEHTEESLLQAEVRHNMAQRNAVVMAKNLCSACPVKAECLRWVMAAESDDCLVYGVVAGLTQKERTRMRKRL